MEDENLYDEFGNYIGPEMDVSDDDDGSSDSDSHDASGRRSNQRNRSDNSSSSYAYEKPVSERHNNEHLANHSSSMAITWPITRAIALDFLKKINHFWLKFNRVSFLLGVMYRMSRTQGGVLLGATEVTKAR